MQLFSNFIRRLRRVGFKIAELRLVLLHYSFFGFYVVTVKGTYHVSFQFD